MRVVVTGFSGQLGSTLVEIPANGHEVLGWDLPDCDLTASDVAHRVEDAWPDVIIHAAAASDVDWCERNPSLAMAVNAEGTRRLAMACRRVGVSLLYISTDYVFDGTGRRPYAEGARPNPLNMYGRSKLLGERAVRDLVKDHWIVRTAWLFSDHGRNFVRTILRGAQSDGSLRVVADQVGSPTYVPDLARAIALLVEQGTKGTHHVVNSGETSWFEYARAIVRLCYNGTVSVAPISSPELGLPAQRPAYSVLDTRKYKALAGGRLRPWQDALRECLAQLHEWPKPPGLGGDASEIRAYALSSGEFRLPTHPQTRSRR